MHRRNFLYLTGAGLLLSARGLLGAVRICPKCGYEQEDATASFCSHCGKPLADAAPAPAEPAPQPAPTPSASGLDPQWARQLAGVTKQNYDRGDLALSFLLSRQAMVHLRAAAPQDVALAAELRRIEQEAGRSLRLGAASCPLCEGTGKRKLLFVSAKGEPQVQVAPSMVCPLCDGGGSLRRDTTAAEWRDQLLEVGRRYQALLRSLGAEETAEVWLPAGRADTLAARDAAALRTGAAIHCTTCAGFAETACDTCLGAGRERCQDEECVMGQVVCPTCEGKRKLTVDDDGRQMQKTCQTCRQTGIAACPECEGRGYATCKACTGRGRKVCMTCKGSGQRPVCSKCEGKGLTECRSCKGVGKYRGAECPTCHGEKITLCTSCKGAGRRTR